MVRQSEFVGKQQLALQGQRDSDKEGVEADVNRMNSKGKVAQYKNSSSSCTRCRNQHETREVPRTDLSFDVIKEGISGPNVFPRGPHRRYWIRRWIASKVR